MKYQYVINEIKARYNPKNVEGMARFGISTKNAFGVSMPFLRSQAKAIGKDHQLALRLWNSKIHEARILAALIADPHLMTEELMENWVKDFDSWDICDQTCSNLFDKTRCASRKAMEWSDRNEEFVKRAGFVIMAALAVHDKRAGNEVFEGFLPLIARESDDERNFVRKAINWALRQIGKRNRYLHDKAIKTASNISARNTKSSRWIAADALRELRNPAVIDRIKR